MTAPETTGSHVLDELAEVIGREAALELAWEFRGERLYIPKDKTREPRIAEAIGETAATKFCDVFWRTTITLPMTVALKHKVLQLVEQGEMTKREIARFCHIREARVYDIIARDRDDKRQPRLL
ncbi:MAG: hypothetical protein COW16_10515 [Sphingomonadales bacterium CG12_big_fil_rev_8_21_14_0_65_65_10]|nr:MAG: hypothetical protein COW16_10515 [Sphingomonadales bacterium CG12_big_fil_rev_8_21_14_0_65_65_10]